MGTEEAGLEGLSWREDAHPRRFLQLFRFLTCFLCCFLANFLFHH